MRRQVGSGPSLFLLACLGTGFLFGAGCSDNPAQPGTIADIHGHVRDADSGQAVVGARTYLGQSLSGFSTRQTAIIDSTLTTFDGAYAFDNLPPGNFRVYAGVWNDTDRGFSLVSPFSPELVVGDKRATGATDLDLVRVRPDGEVSGTVSFEQPALAPAEGADVQLYRFLGAETIPVGKALTDAHGRYLLSQVMTGNYVVAASLEFVPGESIFPLYMSGESVPFFCNGEGVVAVDTLLLRELAVEKPAIYLYPAETAEIAVTLQLGAAARVTASLPPYERGWRVTATPTGRLDGQFDYLFYELAVRGAPILADGWCLAQADLAAQLAPILMDLGLQSPEIAAFLDYWLPRLPADDYTLVYPVLNEDLDFWVDLDVDPAPQSALRVWLFFAGSRQPVALTPPTVTPFVREGFTLVEWGGAVVPRSGVADGNL